ncbi:MAG: hypothetical protein LUG18_15735 [Candidatus Azobacteroides sp.]|nr:hypothetical protein [Candidatus Azobacteroides sp.]
MKRNVLFVLVGLWLAGGLSHISYGENRKEAGRDGLWKESASFGRKSSFSEQKGDAESKGVFAGSETNLFFVTDKDEDSSLSAPPPGGGEPLKVPLKDRDWQVWSLLSLTIIFFHYFRKRNVFT